MSRKDCTELSALCTVEYTPYGYIPNLAANALYCAIFALCGILQVTFGIRYKTWTFALGLVIGTFLEMAGYVGRLLLHNNPFNSSGNKLQIVALVLAPSFIAAAIDLSAKHIVLIFGPEWCRLKPRLIPIIFISIDFGAIVVQAIGGSLAAVGETQPKLLEVGDNIIVAGLAVQVFQLGLFGAFMLEYALRTIRNKSQVSPEALAYARTTKFRWFVGNLCLAYLVVLIRCIYRIPEMAGGWGQGLQRNEPKFLVLDGAMVVICSICLTWAHPGIFFPFLGKGSAAHKLLEHDSEKSGNIAADSGSENPGTTGAA